MLLQQQAIVNLQTCKCHHASPENYLYLVLLDLVIDGSWIEIPVWKWIIRKYYTNVLYLLLSECCVQKKNLHEIFPILSNNCRGMGNVRAGTEIVNPCIKIDKCLIHTKCLLHFKYASGAMCPTCISEVISAWVLVSYIGDGAAQSNL